MSLHCAPEPGYSTVQETLECPAKINCHVVISEQLVEDPERMSLTMEAPEEEKKKGDPGGTETQTQQFLEQSSCL